MNRRVCSCGHSWYDHQQGHCASCACVQYRAARNTSTNPMIGFYGPHPTEGERCKGCKHLVCYQFAGRYYKCLLRGDTASAKTDHRLSWPACARKENLAKAEQMIKEGVS